LASEIAQIRTVTLKRIGKMDRDQLLQELKSTRTLLGTKGKDKWKTVLVIALSVAAAGLVTWAVVSATQRKWDKKRQELEDGEKKRQDDLKKEWASQEEELEAIYQARADLRDRGFVWSICGTQDFTTTVGCSY